MESSLPGKQQALALARDQRFDEARTLLTSLCEQTPDDAEAWFMLGAIHGQSGEFPEAENCCRRALQLQPDHAGLHYNLGIALLNQGRVDEPIASLEKAIQLNPQYAEAYHDLGNALQTRGDPEQAIDKYRQAINLQPDFFLVHYNLGNACRDLGRLDEAAASYEQTLRLNPDFSRACDELATIYINRFQYDQAIELLVPAVMRMPDAADLHFKLGAAYQETGNTEAALQAYQQTLKINPEHAEANYGIGRILRLQGQLTEAIKRFEAVLAVKPDYAEVLAVLGGTRKDQGRIEEALPAFRQAMELQPDRADFRSSYLFNLNYSAHITPAEIFSEHCRLSRASCSSHNPLQTRDNLPEPERPLRVGYVSPDFRVHSVAYFLEPLLKHHDRKNFEWYCYSDLRLHKADNTTTRLKHHADHWRDITPMNDARVADRIKADGIDILVDLAGHTAGNRLGLFALKPAPVQVSYLGYPNTTGLATIDYRLTDRWADPDPAANQYYTESLARLPQGFLCYQPPEAAPAPCLPPVLSTGYITFGSFNNLAKVIPDVVRTWACILNAVTDSRLVIKNSSFRDEPTCEYYYSLFSDAGVKRERITLSPGTASLSEHLAMYNTVDIALDTFPYNGTTTTCEALWMGVPVVTLKGTTHANRVGFSILMQTGLDDFVTTSTEGYITLATHMACKPEYLAQVRHGLRNRLKSSSLCNPHEKTSNIEKFYRTAWRNWCNSTSKQVSN